MLAAFALKAVLLHVVGKIRKLGPCLCFDPFPRKEASNQSARKRKESQVLVEQTEDNPEGDSEKYRSQGNPEVIDIDRTKTHYFSEQAIVGGHSELLGVLALALRACQIHHNSPFLKYLNFVDLLPDSGI
jgi:hypothetical protein